MDIEKQFLHLGRLALSGKVSDARIMLKKCKKTILARRPDLVEDYERILKTERQHVTRGTVVEFQMPLPVDQDSRLELVKRETLDELIPMPVWTDDILDELQDAVKERDHINELEQASIVPTRSLLFVGPPGVGKTLAARWLAYHLSRPLLTLDLAAVMSSFLGKTGGNIRTVLDYAQQQPSVLLLDEFDAIAKRRDDSSEVGELKRLVTVLLQSIDNWPDNGILIAATNHAELLDPAVWRRFDRVITFTSPTSQQLREVLGNLLDLEVAMGAVNTRHLDLLASLWEGRSFAEVNRETNKLRRSAIVNNESVTERVERLIRQESSLVGKAHKRQVVNNLHALGFTKIEISKATGISRPTINKYLQSYEDGG